MKKLIFILILFSVIAFPQGKKSVLTEAQKDSIGAMIRDSALVVNQNEYWISPISGKANATGSINDPFDGSTSTKFDIILQGWYDAVDTNLVIHLLPGTFHTKGTYSYGLRTGWQIIGSGIDITRIELDNGSRAAGNTILSTLSGSANCSVFWGGNFGDPLLYYSKVSDMTIDVNYDGQNTGGNFTAGAIYLGGSYNTIERVRVVNAGGLVLESFPLQIGGSYNHSLGNLIANCIVDSVQGFGTMISFGNDVNTGGEDYFTSGVISNNIVLGDTTFPSFAGVIAYGGYALSDVIFDNNYCKNIDYGFNIDSDVNKNVIINRTTMINCKSYGIQIGGTGLNTFDNFTISNNTAILTQASLFSSPWGNITNTRINNNTAVRKEDAIGTTIYGIGISEYQSLEDNIIIFNNVIDSSAQSTHVELATTFNNYDNVGDLPYGFPTPSISQYSINTTSSTGRLNVGSTDDYVPEIYIYGSSGNLGGAIQIADSSDADSVTSMIIGSINKSQGGETTTKRKIIQANGASLQLNTTGADSIIFSVGSWAKPVMIIYPDSSITMAGNLTVGSKLRADSLQVGDNGITIDSIKIDTDSLFFWVGGNKYKAVKSDFWWFLFGLPFLRLFKRKQ